MRTLSERKVQIQLEGKPRQGQRPWRERKGSRWKNRAGRVCETAHRLSP